MIDIDFPAYIELGPERLLHLNRVTGDESAAEGSMKTGIWLHDEVGLPSAGALGVLADDVLGYCVAVGTPAGSSTVTTALHLDLLAPIPVDGGLVHSRIDSVTFDSTGAVATGRMFDDTGVVIAVGSLRGRFVDGSPPSEMDMDRHPGPRVDPDAQSVLSALGGEFVREPGGMRLQFPISARNANVSRNIHGGMTFCALELTATNALREGEAAAGFVTASIDVQYLRGAPMEAELTCAAQVIHSGRSLSVARVEAYVEVGKPIATATVMRHRVP